ncbi:hypothetical protein [Euzebya tangerina]|uniref:hypothetical protein n=1 Tax=Euzebya tangerina TaxID=591198 RepID=UPI000E31CA58|nr:hypothetical protein [Euzebya tangerina]
MSQPDVPDGRAGQLAAHINALNLAGLSFATKRLLGSDASRVSGQFTMWARQELNGLPSLTTPLWTALAPLDMGRPAEESAGTCERVLRGRHGDADEAIAAASRCATAGKMAFAVSPAPGPAGVPEDVAARRKALIRGVKDYWRALGAVYDEVRARVVTGEYPRAVRMVAKAQSALEPTLHDIAALAAALGTGVPESASAPAHSDMLEDEAVVDASPVLEETLEPAAAEAHAPPAHERARQDDVTSDVETSDDPLGAEADLTVPESVAPTRPRRQPTPLGAREEIEAKAEAFARAGQVRQVRDQSEVQPRPVEVLSTKPVRNRVFAPILFLIAVAGVALFVIFNVLNGPNPLAGN